VLLSRLKPRDIGPWLPLAAAQFAAPLSLLLSSLTTLPALADTETVRVQVQFIERIHVGHQSDDESPAGAAVATDPAPTVPPRPGEPDGTFVTAFSIQATPHRAVTFNVTAAGSAAPAHFVCSYGEYRLASCGAAGLAATSLAEDELRIDRASESQSQSGQRPPAEIQVTIAYQ